MLDLFRMDAESQVQVLTDGLLLLERNPAAAEQLEACMRAAHSLKGGASIVGLKVGVDLTRAMENCFVAAQRGAITLRQKHIDLLLQGVDLLTNLAKTPEPQLERWANERQVEVSAFLAALATMLESNAESQDEALSPEMQAILPAHPMSLSAAPVSTRSASERVLRVNADNLNRLLGLAGESLVESRWLKPFADSLLRLKRLHHDAGKAFDSLREAVAEQPLSEHAQIAFGLLQQSVVECRELLSERLAQLELFDRRSANLAHRLYDQALACRMRPFADGVQAFPRMVRDVAQALGKQVRLEVIGEATQVDRDILEKLDAPLGHMLRNAIDHGLESPQERRNVGKPAEGVIHLEARHSAGLLQILISDDGRGIDPELLRVAIVQRRLTAADTAQQMSEAELLEFLFLPGFTMKETVTDISGRGVGLDVVQTMIKQVRGNVRVSSQAGKGARFQLQLPLTLSVVRTLLADIGGEPYAFPLAYIVRTLKLPRERIEVLEGRQLFDLEGRYVGLVSAHQLLGGGEIKLAGEELAVIVVGDGGNSYGLVVDRFLGEYELVVQPLDARFGKIHDIAAGALMDDGSPVLIVDLEDLLRSVDKLASAGDLSKLQRGAANGAGKQRKRVLIADDSFTVRELERKLLDHSGYMVEIAVDGMDGWNAVRTGHFDLVITDIDMPRMDGIELLTLIKKDPNLKSLPVIIVSYKDREEDRRRGLEAGADYYLTKGSFHDETLLQAVVDLIGVAVA
jgi:two-component system sensor histidine kinase and response regulator WspE